MEGRRAAFDELGPTLRNAFALHAFLRRLGFGDENIQLANRTQHTVVLLAAQGMQLTFTCGSAVPALGAALERAIAIWNDASAEERERCCCDSPWCDVDVMADIIVALVSHGFDIPNGPVQVVRLQPRRVPRAQA